MKKHPSSMGYQPISFDQLQKELNEAVAEWQRERGLDKNFHPIKGFKKRKSRVEHRHHYYTKLLKKGGSL